MTERLLKGEIKYAKEKNRGEGQYGEWVLYNFTIVDKDWDGIFFDYFQSGNKPVPVVGMEYDVLEYEIKENTTDKGTFTNYSVTKLLLPEGAASKPKPVPQNLNTPSPQPNKQNGQAYISHGEAVCRIMEMVAKDDMVFDRPYYERLLKAFKFGIRFLTTETIPQQKTPKPEPEPQEPDPEIPF